MPDTITISNNCTEDEFVNAVRIGGLLQYNMEKTGGKLAIPDLEITRVARDASGTIIGGAQGSTYLSSVEIEVLWVNPAYRGQGIAGRLLCEVETEAKAAGCLLSHLTTYSFQAPIFYQKQGYTLCGEIDGFADDIKLYFLKKAL